jgi:hypothetical protein
VVYDYPTIDCFSDDRPSQLQLFERIVRPQLMFRRELKGTEQRCALSCDRWAAAVLPSSFTLIVSRPGHAPGHVIARDLGREVDWGIAPSPGQA